MPKQELPQVLYPLPVYCSREKEGHPKKYGLFGFFFFFFFSQRRALVKWLRVQAVQDAKRMSQAKRGKMKEKKDMQSRAGCTALRPGGA